MKKIYFLLLPILLISACNEPKIDQEITIRTVKVNDRSDEVLMSTLIDTINVIPLDNQELIGSVNEILWTPERIIILDSKKTKKVFIYDLAGKLINSIESGTGEPGKFVWPYASTLSLDEETFYLISDRTKHLLQYDMQGELLNDFDISHLGQVNDMIATERGFAFSAKPDSQPTQNIIFTDSNFQITGGIDAADYYDQLPFLSGGATNSFYPSESSGHFYFKELMSNTILEIENEKVLGIHYLDLPDSYEVDYSITGRSIPEVLEYSRENGLVKLNENHVNFGSNFIIDLSNSGRGTLGLWNLKKSRLNFVSNLKNDLSVLIDIGAVWGTYNNSPGKLVTALEAPIMTKLLESVDYSQSSYVSIFETLNITNEDNPVLIVYELNENFAWPFD